MITALFDQSLRREQGSLSSYTFTLTFPGGQIAVLQVNGASDLIQARSLAQQAITQRVTVTIHGEQVERALSYTVTDGDLTGGHAELFYMWCSSAAQEAKTQID